MSLILMGLQYTSNYTSEYVYIFVVDMASPKAIFQIAKFNVLLIYMRLVSTYHIFPFERQIKSDCSPNVHS